jgi:hypothetical protein
MMPRQDTQCNGGCQHTTPTRLCVRTGAALRRGLDGALSAVSARPAGQATRGFIIELLVRHPDWRSDGWQQERRAAAMRRHSAPQPTQ